MIIYKIPCSDWLIFPQTIVNFNHFFMQLTPGETRDFCPCVTNQSESSTIGSRQKIDRTTLTAKDDPNNYTAEIKIKIMELTALH